MLRWGPKYKGMGNGENGIEFVVVLAKYVFLLLTIDIVLFVHGESDWFVQ